MNKVKKIDGFYYLIDDEADVNFDEGTELEEVSYPGGANALYDEATNTYYNFCGQKLKQPEDYLPDNDGRYY